MARRYTTSIVLPTLKTTSGFYSDSANITDDGVLRVLRPINSFIRCAPSRYSGVRKVTFSLGIQWHENNPARTVDARIMVAPMVSSTSARIIETLSIPPGTSRKTSDSVGGQIPWSYEPNNVVNANYQNIFLYSRRGGLETIVGDVTGLAVAGDITMLSVTFDRFSGVDDDFFADWDAVAELENDDAYVAFNIYLCLVESTFTAGSSGNFVPVSQGMHITQAPRPENNTCTVVPCSRFGFYTVHANVLRRTAYSVHPDEISGRWLYNADEWNGITQICQWNQMCGGTLIAADDWETGVFQVGPPAGSRTQIDMQSINNLSGSNFMDILRGADISSLISDGDVIGGDYFVDGVGANQTSSGLQQLEIIQKSTTKKVFYISAGRSPGDAQASHAAVCGHGYFDPLFFEDFEDELITARRMEGTLRHELMTNLYQANVRHDAQLDSRDDRTDGPSATALTVGGGQFTSSGLDDLLNTQQVFQTYGIDGNDPLQLAGTRKVYQKTSASVVGADDGGVAVLAYAHEVPLTEFPELGPLFELGSFNPEGCAATSAGLGDPGILVITNGSTIPQKFNPQANNIEDNGVPYPFKDETPSPTVDDTAASPENGLGLGTYTYRYTFRNCCTGKESNPNPDDIVVDTTGASPAAEVTLSFAGIRIPDDPQICEICVYRTTLGGDYPVMAKVGCFNPDETELFVDTVADAALDFTNDGLSLLNAPMPCVPVVVEFQNRLFGLGDIPDLSPAGTVSVVQGSDVVTGDEDVEWTRCLAGKYIQMEGDCRQYEILSVQPPAAGLSPPYGRLCLVEEYEGETATGLNYTICGRPNRLYVSEPFEPECWPEASFLDVEPGDGDRLIGAISNFSRLVVCKRNKSYVLTFRENPVLEVASLSRISSDIGCIGPRTFAQVESGSVWLADRGLALFDGRGVQHIPESDRMNELFVDPDNPRYVRRDRNGRVIGAVGAFYPKREQYLCLLPTVQTTRGANLMVVWDIKLRNVTLYEFCQEFASMVVAKDADGNERVYLGDTNGFVWILDIGDNDGVGYPNATGTVRGFITSAGIDAATGASFLEDTSASFITGGLPQLAGLSGAAGLSGSFDGNETGLAGVCVHYRPADAALDTPWEVRTVYAATSTRLYVSPNWAGETPEAGYEYMLGAINFQAVFKQRDYGTNDLLKRNWSHILTYVPEDVATQLRVELRTDLEDFDAFEDFVENSEGVAGGGRIFDLSFSKGRQMQPVAIDVHNFMQVEMSNFAPDEPARILNHTLRMTGRAQ